MTVHYGITAPTLAARWDPFDVDYLWVAWDGMLRSATIISSEWVIPSGWTAVAEQFSATVTDDTGATYSAVNGVLLRTTETKGRHPISNRVELSDGRQYERTVVLSVRSL